MPCSFNQDVAEIIAKYLGKYVLLDWIELDKLNIETLNRNKRAIDLLEENPHLRRQNIRPYSGATDIIDHYIGQMTKLIHYLDDNEHDEFKERINKKREQFIRDNYMMKLINKYARDHTVLRLTKRIESCDFHNKRDEISCVHISSLYDYPYIICILPGVIMRNDIVQYIPEEYMPHINWKRASLYTLYIKYLLEDESRISWTTFCGNLSAMSTLEKNIGRYPYHLISSNQAIFRLSFDQNIVSSLTGIVWED